MDYKRITQKNHEPKCYTDIGIKPAVQNKNYAIEDMKTFNFILKCRVLDFIEDQNQFDDEFKREDYDSCLDNDLEFLYQESIVYDLVFEKFYYGHKIKSNGGMEGMFYHFNYDHENLYGEYFLIIEIPHMKILEHMNSDFDIFKDLSIKGFLSDE